MVALNHLCKNVSTYFDEPPYQTYKALAYPLGRPPTRAEILHITAATEYADRAWQGGSVIIPTNSAYSVRAAGQEGLARNYYEACGGDPNCATEDQYEFMSGYQPWMGYKQAGDGSPEARATHLLNALHKYDDLPSVNNGLYADVEDILGPKSADAGWRSGYDPDVPWQWYGPTSRTPNGGVNNNQFGMGNAKFAILAVDLGGGSYFYMFTGAQDKIYNGR